MVVVVNVAVVVVAIILHACFAAIRFHAWLLRSASQLVLDQIGCCLINADPVVEFASDSQNACWFTWSLVR